MILFIQYIMQEVPIFVCYTGTGSGDRERLVRRQPHSHEIPAQLLEIFKV